MHGATIPTEFTRQDGRKFGMPVGLAFMALAALVWWRGAETTWMVLGGLGVALFLAGILIPGMLGPVYRGWMRFALLLSRVTTPIFMGLVYFGIFLVTGLLRRNVGQNPMVHRPDGDSFWARRDRTRGDLERQF